MDDKFCKNGHRVIQPILNFGTPSVFVE